VSGQTLNVAVRADEDDGRPTFGLLSQPYHGAAVAFRDPRKAPPVADPRIAEGLTEAAHAERLAGHLRDVLRYDHQRRMWLMWDRYRWAEDKVCKRYQLAIDGARDLYLRAALIQNLKTKEAVANFAIHCESRRVIEAVLELLKNLPPIAEAGDGWNSNREELNTPSCVVNLRTGRTRDATPDDRLTFATSTMYIPAASCPTWEKTIADVMNNNAEMIDFLQRFLGYSITGETSEQVYGHCVGGGANGKSTVFDGVGSVLGDYFHATPFTTFEAGQRTSIGNDLAALPGKRLVLSSEVNTGTKLNTARIKALTGGDRMSARHLYCNAFEFYPVCKLWLSTNHRPSITDDSFGIWRRILMIPFSVTFTGARADKHLKEKLGAEGEGILRWLVDGAIRWYAEGLNPPALVREAVDDYERTSDPIADFIDERCVQGADERCRAADLYAAYGRWCDGVGITDRSADRLSMRAFGERVKAKFPSKKRNSGIVYLGITCRE
jgi:putative DNA primase/helicase